MATTTAASLDREASMAYMRGAYVQATSHGSRETGKEDEISTTSSGIVSAVSSLIGLDVSSSTASGSMMYSEDDIASDAGRKEKSSFDDESSLPFDCQSIKSEESSLLLFDQYFQDPLCVPGPANIKDDSISSSLCDEMTVDKRSRQQARGRRIARCISRPMRRRRSKPQHPSKRGDRRRDGTTAGLVKRAIRSLRKHKSDKMSLLDEVQSLPSPSYLSGDLHRLSPASSKGTWSLSLNPTDELEDAFDTVSEISDAVEVWTMDSMSPGSEEKSITDLLTSPLPVSLTRNLEEAFDDDDATPEGLRGHTSMEEIIGKLRLGMQGWSALTSLEDAASTAADKFDPCQPCASPTSIRTMRVADDFDIPDYGTYVREAVNNFRKNILHMSDETYISLQDRLGMTCSSKLRRQ